MVRELKIAPLTEAYALDVASDMRLEERIEVMASHGETPMLAVMKSWELSMEAYAALDENGEHAICAFGFIPNELGSNPFDPTDDSWTNAWFLGNSSVPRLWRPFIRTCIAQRQRFLNEYPKLWNYTDARYTLSLNWLSWLGFEIGKPEPWGYKGDMFCLVSCDSTKHKKE